MVERGGRLKLGHLGHGGVEGKDRVAEEIYTESSVWVRRRRGRVQIILNPFSYRSTF